LLAPSARNATPRRDQSSASASFLLPAGQRRHRAVRARSASWPASLAPIRSTRRVPNSVLYTRTGYGRRAPQRAHLGRIEGIVVRLRLWRVAGLTERWPDRR